MPINDHDRFDSAWPPSGATPASSRESVSADGPHPHRAFYTRVDIDFDARLEWLDDLMFAAIEGDPVALDHAAEAWHQTRDELGAIALEESRQQYMRRAQTVWHSLRTKPNHPPHKVFAAIEIISLLATKNH